MTAGERESHPDRLQVQPRRLGSSIDSAMLTRLHDEGSCGRGAVPCDTPVIHLYIIISTVLPFFAVSYISAGNWGRDRGPDKSPSFEPSISFKQIHL